ncbi:uncharacterized protein LOC129740493 isoform X2 [Uranotaenia lowii]|nr:uncharacterized protein LOC129740493 isoform X2 [Uranotaenia lowii]
MSSDDQPSYTFFKIEPSTVEDNEQVVLDNPVQVLEKVDWMTNVHDTKTFVEKSPIEDELSLQGFIKTETQTARDVEIQEFDKSTAVNNCPQPENDKGKYATKEIFKLSCDQCSKKFKGQRALKRHTTLAHSLKPRYQCEVCKSQFTYPSKLSAHVDQCKAKFGMDVDTSLTSVDRTSTESPVELSSNLITSSIEIKEEDCWQMNLEHDDSLSSNGKKPTTTTCQNCGSTVSSIDTNHPNQEVYSAPHLPVASSTLGVGDFLKRNNLTQYVKTFENAEITLQDLPYLKTNVSELALLIPVMRDRMKFVEAIEMSRIDKAVQVSLEFELTPELDLMELCLQSEDGKKFLKLMENLNTMTHQSRNILKYVLVSHYFHRGKGRINKRGFEEMVKIIKKNYPEEIGCIWYQGIKGNQCAGLLYTCYRYMLKQFRSKDKPDPEPEPQVAAEGKGEEEILEGQESTEPVSNLDFAPRVDLKELCKESDEGKQFLELMENKTHLTGKSRDLLKIVLVKYFFQIGLGTIPCLSFEEMFQMIIKYYPDEILSTWYIPSTQGYNAKGLLYLRYRYLLRLSAKARGKDNAAALKKKLDAPAAPEFTKPSVVPRMDLKELCSQCEQGRAFLELMKDRSTLTSESRRILKMVLVDYFYKLGRGHVPTLTFLEMVQMIKEHYPDEIDKEWFVQRRVDQGGHKGALYIRYRFLRKAAIKNRK